MKKKERLEAIIAYYCDGRKGDFALMLGLKPSAISTWLDRDTYDTERIFAKCENISAEWLLTGKGEMIINKYERETKEALSQLIASQQKTIETQEELIKSLKDQIDMLKRGTAPQTYVATA